MSEPRPPTATDPQTEYEASDWAVGRIGLAMLGLLVFIAVAVLVLRVVFHDAGSDVERSLAIVPPEPRLQIAPAGDLARLRAEEERALNTYYWIDRDRGVVHIPIDEAMKQVVARGIDGFPQ